MSQQKYPRRKKFIDASFQTQFIAKFCIILSVASVAILGIIYLLATQYTSIEIVNSRVMVKSAADFLWPLMVQTGVLIFFFAGIVTILTTLYVSHKIAGPMYRFKMSLNEIAKGDLSHNVHTREKDQLTELKDAINGMVGETRDKIVSSKAGLKALQQAADEGNMDLVKKEAQKLQHQLDRFKV